MSYTLINLYYRGKETYFVLFCDADQTKLFVFTLFGRPLALSAGNVEASMYVL